MKQKTSSSYPVKSLIAGVIALLTSSHALATDPPKVEFLNSGTILPANMPFSEAVQVDHTLYLSGVLGNMPGTMKLAEGGIRGEAKQTLDNLNAILHAHGYSMKNLVKCTVMLADIADWPTFNTVYHDALQAPYPARSAFAASGLALGARVEIECIAVR